MKKFATIVCSRRFELRVGNYRVVYDFDRSEGRIDALTVGDRKDIYERFL